MPFGQVPLVERVGGANLQKPWFNLTPYSDGSTITRYLRVFGESNSLVDLVSDGTEDVRKRLMKAVYAPEEEKKEKMEAYSTTPRLGLRTLSALRKPQISEKFDRESMDCMHQHSNDGDYLLYI